MCRSKCIDDGCRQTGKLEISTEPALASLEPLRHTSLITVVVTLERPEVVARPLNIGEVSTTSVFKVGDAKRLFIGQLARLNEELEIGMTMVAHPRRSPVPSRAADNLEFDCR